ncbi:DHHC palmitoyltransferase family protein [Candida parapsilosis]|uniref:Palmitoyltransferase n=2 Tax=Candida parapsilosis TaxID=5480 RepID=G8BBM3_CANPC|nr:uncharacterized protein CPAR2_800900 [Candida parapsilosis]KAF6051439.1 DHHC palmitoyltransferase family protein [Candida parapsilosis]KAF6053064.1 DHHC palmitoyltransferase family protein [Candida parapsilosis]KAF6053241.1 DHHC palmitoyltransferase family protein [Candida parapsilosis]KAF6064842.1 DHHC palmitoyltransferase family protein [Candida parapsilosis]KAI5902169.1 Palmitoyltransferase SWF1 [Candida parapsilosis]
MLFRLILGISITSLLLTILLIFGDSPSFRNTPVQHARVQLFTVFGKLSNFYNYIDKRTDGKFIQYFGWLVPIGYVIVLTICFQQFWVKTKPMIDIGQINMSYILLSMALTYGSTILCALSDPGTVTIKSIKSYPYLPNQLIFFRDNKCNTCQVSKPARSKHCSVCGHCYLLYDHHCVWVNNCIGWKNYKWFFLFLVANINMLVYGGILCYQALSSHLTQLTQLWRVITKTTDANKVTGIFLILCSIFSPVVVLFTGLHLRYIYLGVTTNELDKWGEVEYLVDLGSLYKVSPSIGNETFVEKARDSTGAIVYISLKDERILISEATVSGYTLTPVNSVVDDLVNDYDRGFWNNFKDRVLI